MFYIKTKNGIYKCNDLFISQFGSDIGLMNEEEFYIIKYPNIEEAEKIIEYVFVKLQLGKTYIEIE